MNLPFIIDVAIGLLFIYLILSLLASELQELITTLLQWRAKHLKDSIENLLSGGTGSQQEEQTKYLVDRLYNNPLLQSVNQEARGIIATGVRAMTRWLPGNRKGEYGGIQSTGPSYIAPETFATSLMDSLGLGVLADKLTEVRLGKFSTRIVGKFSSNSDGTISIPDDDSLQSNFERGGIRLISEKVGLKNLYQNERFKILVEDYDDIVKDYQAGQADLTTAVERMGRSLDSYIEAIAQIDPQELALEPRARDFLLRRLHLFKDGLFGDSNERAIQSGGLRPSAYEIGEMLNQTSKVHREIAGAYEAMQTNAEAITEKVNAEIAPMLEEYNQGLKQPLTLKQLSNEQRRLFINQAFANLIASNSLTEEDRKIYDNYETYQEIKLALSRVPQPVRTTLEALARRAHSKVEQTGNYIFQFREEVATWFDRSMSRASGVYKRNAKGVAILLGMMLAIIANADSFFIADRLSNDENLRKVVTDRAAQLSTNTNTKITEPELEELKVKADAALRDLTLPVGWSPANVIRQFQCKVPPTSDATGQVIQKSRAEEWAEVEASCIDTKVDSNLPVPLQLVYSKPLEFLRRFMGWLITGIAISMGAPFWFDLLGKLINVRNTGSKPPTKEGS